MVSRYASLILLLVPLAACSSSMLEGEWQRHQTLLADDEQHKEYNKAVRDERWLIDNAFSEAPPPQRSQAAEAARYMHLAKLAIKAGQTREAVESLRQALQADPQQAAAVRAQVEHLPLPPAQLAKVKQEFAWNIAALAPGEDVGGESEDDSRQCWSYRAQEVRLHHQRTVETPDGLERQVTYDARPWIFDVEKNHWSPDGPWILDAGTEVELANGPGQPRYRAMVAADHQFVAEDRVPPCHRQAWEGPYATNGTVFFARHLPSPAVQ